MTRESLLAKVGTNWLMLLGLSSLLVLLFELVRLPAALLLGPMLGGIVMAANGRAVALPKLVVNAGQGVIGVMIAAILPFAVLGEIARDWPIFAGGVVAVIIAAVGLGWSLARMGVLPGTTAIWGSMPGASTAMTLMAGSFGADVRLVAFMQYLRVVCVSIVATVIARIWVGHGGVAPPPTDWFPAIDGKALGVAVLLIVAGWLASRFLRFPGGIFLLPMAGGMAVQATGIADLHLPPWLLAASYAIVGWSIGLRFDRVILRHAARALPRVLLSIGLLIAICGLFAAVLVMVADVDPLTAYLATSPGGADSVAIISAASGVDVPFVMAMQMTRFLVLLITGPAIARLIVRRSGIRDEAPAA